MVLVTGGLGSVGVSTVRALCSRGHSVRVLERRTRRTQARARRLSRRLPCTIGFTWGDIRNREAVRTALEGCRCVVHLAAVIPPAADHDPGLAWAVNVGGTEALLSAAASMVPPPRVVFASSVAVYGDRVSRPMIHATDAVAPRPADVYARSKLAAEERIRASGVPWSILRLSFVLDLDSLRMDPLMFAMPLNTSIEVVAVEDVAAAFASAVDSPAAVGACLHIAGGPACRTTYRAFLRRALACYGFGRRGLPEAAFGTGDFHCGFMDTVESQRLLHYQHATLNELYARMARRRLPLRFLLTPVRPISRAWLLQRSPYYRPARRHIGLRRNAPRLRHGGA